MEIRRHERRAADNTTRPFRYENMWRRHQGYEQLIVESWSLGMSNGGLAGVASSLRTVQGNLQTWNQDLWVSEELRKLRAELEKLRGNSLFLGPS